MTSHPPVVTTAPDAPQARRVAVCLLGYGHVGRAFLELLAARGGDLVTQHGIDVDVAAIGTGRHGCLLPAERLTAQQVLDRSAGAGWAFPDPSRPGPELVRAAAAAGATVVVEATPLTRDGAAATGHVEAALAHGLDVVSVNKGPVAWAYRRLVALAAEHGRRLRVEGVTMDGAPVYNLVRSCLPLVRVEGFEGVLNSTTNDVLDRMASGGLLADAVARAQSLGFAEADPDDDLSGWDAATKAAALANVLMGADITPDEVPRVDVRAVTTQAALDATRRGRRLRVVARAARSGPRVTARLELAEVGPDDPFYALAGTTSSLLLHTDLMGDLQVTEHHGLVPQTAYAVVADLVDLYGHPATA